MRMDIVDYNAKFMLLRKEFSEEGIGQQALALYFWRKQILLEGNAKSRSLRNSSFKKAILKVGLLTAIHHTVSFTETSSLCQTTKDFGDRNAAIFFSPWTRTIEGQKEYNKGDLHLPDSNRNSAYDIDEQPDSGVFSNYRYNFPIGI